MIPKFSKITIMQFVNIAFVEERGQIRPATEEEKLKINIVELA